MNQSSVANEVAEMNSPSPPLIHFVSPHDDARQDFVAGDGRAMRNQQLQELPGLAGHRIKTEDETEGVVLATRSRKMEEVDEEADDSLTSLPTDTEGNFKEGEEESTSGYEELWESHGTLDFLLASSEREKLHSSIYGSTHGRGGDGSSFQDSSIQPSTAAHMPQHLLEEIAIAFEDAVPVFDRRHKLKMYRDCFTGKEGVDFLVRSQYASSRHNAVEIGIQLQLRLNLFEHVHKDHEYSDLDLFYRFVDPALRKTSNQMNHKNAMNQSSSSLDEIAEQLRNNLKVKDRTYKFKNYSQCFVASDAIDFMLSWGISSSRGDAVMIGRRLANEMDLWCHVVDAKKQFDDSYLFFRFNDDDRTSHHDRVTENSITTMTNNIAPINEEGSGINHKDETDHEEGIDAIELMTSKELKEISTSLQQSLKLKTKKYQLKKYKNCFKAADMVEYLLHMKLAKSRKNAIKLALRLKDQLQLWEPVVSKQVVDLQANENIWLFFSVSNDGDDETIEHSERSSNAEVSSIASSSTMQSLMNFGETLRNRLKVKNRWYHLKVYEDCFIASEAIDAMIRYKMVDSRREAVLLGRRLQNEIQLWNHVTNDHDFADDYLFFRFNPETARKIRRESHMISTKIRISDGSSSAASSRSRRPDVQSSSNLWKRDYVEDDGTQSGVSKEFLQYAGEQLRQGVHVQHQTYRLKTYRNVFVGSQAVDFFVQSRLVSSREEAVKLGKVLLSAKLFRHVTNDHFFKDEYLFYRFSDEDLDESSVPSWLSSQLHVDENQASESSLSNSERPHTVTSGSASSYSLRGADMSYEEVAKELRNNVQVKTRKYRLKEYRNCFIGFEAVDYMVQSRIVATREEAVDLIRQAISELQFITHVCGDHMFEDEYLFYRFTAIDRASGSEGGRSSSRSSAVALTLKRSMQTFGSTVQQVHLVFDGILDRSYEDNIFNRSLREVEKRSQVIFVRGPCGSGKTRLVSDFFDAQSHRLVFAHSSFMKEKAMVPYQTLRDLFRDLWERLRHSEFWLDGIASIQEELQGNELLKRTLAHWIPDSANFLLGETSGHFEVAENSLEFNSLYEHGATIAFLALLRAISRVCPVAVFWDDIMWADESSCKLFEFLLSRADLPNVLLCVSCQDENDDKSQVVTRIKEVSGSTGNMTTIQLNDMSLVEVTSFLSQVLRVDENEAIELSQVVFERTHGNLYSVICLLEALQSRALLRYEYSFLKWSFSVEEIRKVTTASENVGTLLADRLRDMQADILEVLKLASCFGGSLNVDLIERSKSVLSIEADVELCLQKACWDRLLIQQSEREYKFAHSTVLEAAYDLLPEGKERERIHWEIGCKLLGSRTHDEGTVFGCVDQLKKGLSFMTNKYRLKVAAASLRAGYRATGLSAFIIASNYFKIGIDALGEQAFLSNHGLAVDLFTAYAETLLVAGDIQGSREVAEIVLKHARVPTEKQSPSLTLLRCLKAEMKYEAEIRLGLEILAEWGEEFPSDSPAKEQLRIQTESAKFCLKSLSLDDVLSLPPMTCGKMEFCMTIMFGLVDSGLKLQKPLWVCFLLGKLVEMTTRYGYCKLTPLIVVFFATDMVHHFSTFDDASKYLQIALQLQEENPSDQQSGVLMNSSYLLSTIEPVSRSMYMALEAYKVAMEAGQIDNAFEAYGIYCWSFFYSGLPFEPLIRDMKDYINQMIDYKQPSVVFHTPLLQTLLNLSGRGATSDPTTLETGETIEKSLLLKSNKSWRENTISNYSMQLAFYFGDIDKATQHYEKLKTMTTIGFAKARIYYQIRIYFFCLICIENFRLTQKRTFKTEAKRYLDELRQLVGKGAINLPHKVKLLEAEYSSLTTNDDSVLSKYRMSIVNSSKAGFVQDSALSNYLCAKFCMETDQWKSRATNHLQDAILRFEEWGATRVAESIRDRHSAFLRCNNGGEDVVKSPRSATSHKSRSHFQSALVASHNSLSTARGLGSLVIESSPNSSKVRNELQDKKRNSLTVPKL